MKHTMMRCLSGATLLVGALLAGGCASQHTLYDWEDYQGQVYAHFEGDNTSPEKQIDALEAGLQKIQAHGATPPPGYHAHLGLLYLQVGRNDQAVGEFKTEKALFPESAHYIDFLLAKKQN